MEADGQSQFDTEPPETGTRRISMPEYAMALAHVASLRSEDPFRKVGAVAIDHANRVIGTAYNGLAPGFDAPSGFWDDRDARRRFMLHAEVNLCSLFTRGTARIVAITTKPCTSCMQMLCAYNVQEIYFRDDYAASEADEIAKLYGVQASAVDRLPLHQRSANRSLTIDPTYAA